MIVSRKVVNNPFIKYRNGGEGFIRWCEEKVCIPIYPNNSDIAIWTPIKNLPKGINIETGKSYWQFWEEQKKVARECLRMKNGRFEFRLIILCWMRGEGKSLFACLIQLWKYFNWPKQQIMLGANSKDQIKFVHFDIMRDIIINSPELLASNGRKNIQEKEIKRRDRAGNVVSIIRSISSFTGIVSNITGYTFSEIFDMKNHRFFVQLDGSIRNIPNALGVIDSTISDKKHVLYQMYYNTNVDRKTTEVYFSYRCSVEGKVEDYWNPNMTTGQLEDYRIKFPFGEFERYFQNLWEAGNLKPITDEMIEEMKMIGVDGRYLCHTEIEGLLKEKYETIKMLGVIGDGIRGEFDGLKSYRIKIKEIQERLIPVNKLYQLTDKYGTNIMADVDVLNELGKMFDTDWAILAGLDMNDPMALRSNARAVCTVVAKGLPGSLSTHIVYDDASTLDYLYFLLRIYIAEHDSLDEMKVVLQKCHEDYANIDVLCSERFAAWDMSKWCEERDVAFEPLFPSYGRQRDGFNAFFRTLKKGLFKYPDISVRGSKSDDIIA